MRRNYSPELLAPAGGWESLVAAIHCGADAVYLGLSCFSARAAAQNFSIQSLPDAVALCHRAGVRIYLAMNTLLYDAECNQALQLAQQACAAGVDALIVQDLGFALLLKKAAPALPLHASTQMTVHTPAGVRFLKEQGFARVVAARELSLDQIRDLCGLGVEIECFVHGALCFSVSGSCYLSGMLGGRSANRGKCAQPCRLPFCAKDGSAHALSLKDLSYVKYLDALQDVGVASFKIEGRMKRPEYVAMAVKAFRMALEGKRPDLRKLQSVFSRSGFTDSYISKKNNVSMFGIRRKQDVQAAHPKLLKEIAADYAKPLQRIGLKATLDLHLGKPAVLTMEDSVHCVQITGEIVRQAQTKPLTKEKLERLVAKLGDTPYFLQSFLCEMEPFVFLSAAAVNDMRRRAVAQLDAVRTRVRPIPFAMPSLSFRAKNFCNDGGFVALFEKASQVCCVDLCARVALPPQEILENADALIPLQNKLAALLPVFFPGGEKRLFSQLDRLKELGVAHLYLQNVGQILPAKERGFVLHGSYMLHCTNSAAIAFYQEAGFEDFVLSPELTLRQMCACSSQLPLGILAYAHFPVMTAKNCPFKEKVGCERCGQKAFLIDRKGKRLQVRCRDGIATLYNPDLLYLGDRLEELAPSFFSVLHFTYETRNEVQAAFDAIRRGKRPDIPITRGWYDRGEGRIKQNG